MAEMEWLVIPQGTEDGGVSDGGSRPRRRRGARELLAYVKFRGCDVDEERSRRASSGGVGRSVVCKSSHRPQQHTTRLGIAPIVSANRGTLVAPAAAIQCLGTGARLC